MWQFLPLGEHSRSGKELSPQFQQHKNEPRVMEQTMSNNLQKLKRKMALKGTAKNAGHLVALLLAAFICTAPLAAQGNGWESKVAPELQKQMNARSTRLSSANTVSVI